ncbi:MAG: ABC transporter permease [Anaerolineales bacterium]|nr:ABC transporter permease [Anaerolineales bacterium]
MNANTTFKTGLSEGAIAVLKKYVTLVVLFGLVLLFSLIAPNFFTPNNFIILLRQVSFTAISSVGLAFVMIAGGMDLSIGAQITLTNVLTAILMARMGVPPIFAILFALVLGTLLGVNNGYISIILKVHPLIVTLGTMTIYKGLGYIAANGNSISGLPESFKFLGQGYIGPVPVPVIIMVLVVIAGAFVLNKTYIGRFVFALGGNEEAARLAGVNVRRMKIFVFGVCGFFSAITSLLLLSRVFSGQVTTGQGMEFDCMTAAVLGGISFKGGEGTISGLLAGVLIIGVLNNALQLLSLGDYYQMVIKGVVLLAAVGFDTYQKNRKSKRTASRRPAEKVATAA